MASYEIFIYTDYLHFTIFYVKLKKKGRPGVYVKTKTGDFVFKPVYVEATDGKRSIVTGTYFYDDDGNTVNTVNIYDEVKKHPGEGN